MFLRQLEYPHQDGRVLLDNALVGNNQFPFENKTAVADRTTDEVTQYPERPLITPDAFGDKARRIVFDPVGMAVIITHEVFHGQNPVAFLIAEKAGQMD